MTPGLTPEEQRAVMDNIGVPSVEFERYRHATFINALQALELFEQDSQRTDVYYQPALMYNNRAEDFHFDYDRPADRVIWMAINYNRGHSITDLTMTDVIVGQSGDWQTTLLPLQFYRNAFIWMRAEKGLA